MTARRIEAFAGRWQITRQITDRRGGAPGRFTGAALLHADGTGGWIWEESGQLRLGEGAPLTATRRYLWQETGARITLLFEDGRYFHSFDPNAARATAQHDCPPDLYDVTYDFSSWPVWRSHWEVRGPRKDYRMDSWHRRS